MEPPKPLSRAEQLYSFAFPAGHAVVWPVNPDSSRTEPQPPQIDPDRETKRANAWSTATRLFSLFAAPNDVASQKQSQGEESEEQVSILWQGSPHISREVRHALVYLLFGEGVADPERGEENLLDWYLTFALDHYHNTVLPEMQKIWSKEPTPENAREFLETVTEYLAAFQQSYVNPFSTHLMPVINSQPGLVLDTRTNEEPFSWIVGRLTRDIITSTAQAIPWKLVSKALGYTILYTAYRIFQIQPEEDEMEDEQQGGATLAPQAQRARLLELLMNMSSVGLGGNRTRGTVVSAMVELLDAFSNSHYMAVDWQGGPSRVPFLREWVRSGCFPFITEVLNHLGVDKSEITESAIKACEEAAISILGKSRTDNLFDYVLNLEESTGAISDIREYSLLPGARHYITTSYVQQMKERILNPGSSTSHIIDFYTYTIRVFSTLDHKGILLDRVSRDIRRSIQSRPDAVNTIIKSLLATESDLDAALSQECKRTSERIPISTELAKEMLHGTGLKTENKEELDWEDMNWIPDPIDAEPNRNEASRGNDIISALVALYDSQDFVTELDSVYGDTLLRFVPGEPPSDCKREKAVLKILKQKVKDIDLKKCQVMLHDSMGAGPLDAIVKVQAAQDNPKKRSMLPFLYQSTGPTDDVNISCKVISRPFWPPLREDSFELPPPVKAAQEAYSKAFESVKPTRKLEWYNGLGLATVRLVFDDTRVWSGECYTFQATVIYYYGSSSATQRGKGPGQGTVLSVDELVDGLNMSEDLVKNALYFWQTQDVLIDAGEGRYAVQEILSSREARKKRSAKAGAAISAIQKPQENLELHRESLTAFLRHILKTSLSQEKAFQRLKNLYPAEGGFNLSIEMMPLLLDKMVADGVITKDGLHYKIKDKSSS